MLWAAFGVKIISDNVAEWQIDTMKKYAKKLKEEETDHFEMTPAEKKSLKRLRKQWIDEATKAFKEMLRGERRME